MFKILLHIFDLENSLTQVCEVMKPVLIQLYCTVFRLKYTEMEMRNRQVNHARNLWDRAVTILPRVSQFWYKYTYMEEMLENVAGARQVCKDDTNLLNT